MRSDIQERRERVLCVEENLDPWMGPSAKPGDIGIFSSRLAKPLRLYIITVTVYIYR
jgi:hypothetical protein